MKTSLRGFLFAGVLAALSIGDYDGNLSAASAQPVQWGYSFQPSGQALALYPGDVTILGTCTGCSGGGISLSNPNTWLATQTFQGAAGTFGIATQNIAETATVTAAAPAATTNYDVLSQSVQLYTTNAANNWTLNVRGNGTTALNTALATGKSVTFAVLTTQGGTAFFQNGFTIDGSAVTPKWQGGTAPAAGNINGLDVYQVTVLKTGASTYTVLESLVQFK